LQVRFLSHLPENLEFMELAGPTVHPRLCALTPI
jgi:hypothetical protein